jgi:hypothetical protein
MTAALLFACARGDTTELDAGPASTGTAGEPDSGADEASSRRDGGGDGPSTKDGSVDAPSSNGADGGADTGSPNTSGMSPDLDLPGPGDPCTVPGSSCPGIKVCRIATPTGGRCEGCTTCGNLHAPCTESSECDILFQCYQGKCATICPLGSSYCGPVTNCLDVGHATHGVCKP